MFIRLVRYIERVNIERGEEGGGMKSDKRFGDLSRSSGAHEGNRTNALTCLRVSIH